MGLLNTILDIIFPESCLGCGAGGVSLCLNCLASAPSAERESAEWIFPAFDYRHPPIKKAVWMLKYKGKRKLATVFAEIIYGRILEELADLQVMQNFTDPLLIPVPLEKDRQKERGFNQAELICRELTKLDNNINFSLKTDILIKIKNTKHQAKVENRSERLRNIIGSFGINEKQTDTKLEGRNIILIDDVITTGATLTEAKKILKRAGARKVVAFTVAH